MKKKYFTKNIFPFFLFVFCSISVISSQSFSSSGLSGENLNNPTSLDFGPNGKLYVAQQDGTIFEYTVTRDGAAPGMGAYSVTTSNQINQVKTGTPNHNDDGTVSTISNRQVTGLLAVGTAAVPVVYVSSSDSRIGGGPSTGDTNLDTNSGVLSRLTWTGSTWDKVDLVRGLPRCEENHSTNGMDIFELGGSTYLLLQQGGNANKGAPSNNFAGASETYLTASLLIVNLTQLAQMETANGGPYIDTRQGTTKYIYDLPTLNDPDKADITNSSPNFPYPVGHPMRNATIDVGDPFGGNNGLNQAFTEAGGPVQIFTPGFRNAYDVVVTADGRIFAGDNGPNVNWGGISVIYGSNGQPKTDQSQANYNPGGGDYVTNDFNEANSAQHGDALHYLGTVNDPNGTYYGGHPDPIRAFPSRAGVKVYEFNGTEWDLTSDLNFGTLLAGVSGYFNANFDITDFPDDPRQGAYLADAAIGDPRVNILDIVNSSTNGLCEYTASNFGGAMQGDLLSASFNGKINRYQLNAAGTGLESKNNSFLSGFGSTPLDVIAQGDNEAFPGTIWAATYGADNVTVFEPNDFATCLEPSDPGYVGSEDYDSDGYTNDDEVANGTDICSGGSKPNDNDGDFLSDLIDDDDDNDGILDTQDVFAIDANNGTATGLPINYPFWNNDPGTGFFGLGFTGLMLDPAGNTDYLDQYELDNLTFGGAGGKATVDAMTPGDAAGTLNSQDNAFQFGIDVDSNSAPFTVQSKIEAPFAGLTSVNDRSYGIYIGNGDQNNYLKVVVSEGLTLNDNILGFEVLSEGGTPNLSSQKYDAPGLQGSTAVEIYISVDPAANTAQSYYSIDSGVNVVALGSPVVLPANFLDPNDTKGMAVGIIGTSKQAGQEFTATWDYINITVDGGSNLAISDNPVDFGTVQTGSGQAQLIPILTNEGGPSAGAIEITGINITGANGPLFTSTTTVPLIIGPGATKTLSINFFPDSNPGSKTANLEIVHSGDNSPFIVPLTAILGEGSTGEQNVIARINAGGALVPATDGQLDWVDNATSGAVSGTGYAVNTGSIFTDNLLYANRDVASIPDYIDESTFNALFEQERYDLAALPEMEYSIEVEDGEYIVNLFIGNSFAGTSTVGSRFFDILIEGEIAADNFDPIVSFGNLAGGMVSYPATVSDGVLNIAFAHETENPLVSAIEVVSVAQEPTAITVVAIPDQLSAVGDQSTISVGASGGDPQENFTYAISGQPIGIDIEPTNGQIFGTIAEEALTGGTNGDGIHQVMVAVSKPGSETVSINFIWTVAINDIYTITASAGIGGEISPAGEVPVTNGGNQIFNMTAEEGFEVADVLVDSVSIGVAETYTFADVSEGHTIHVIFTQFGNEIPIAVATSDISTGEAPLPVAFDGSTSSDDEPIAQYSWNFGDGSVIVTGVSVSHVYETPGDYSAILSVEDSQGIIATDTIAITVTESTNPVNNGEVVVFPNPASDIINFNFNDNVEIRNFAIFSINGKMLQEVTGIDVKQQGGYMLNVSGLSVGLYVVEAIDSNGESIKRKILIQR